MAINDQIWDGKLQQDIKRKAAEISAWSSGKIVKYEYLTGKERLPSNEQQIIEQAKFTYPPLGKACEKQIKKLKIKENRRTNKISQTNFSKGLRKCWN